MQQVTEIYVSTVLSTKDKAVKQKDKIFWPMAFAFW